MAIKKKPDAEKKKKGEPSKAPTKAAAKGPAKAAAKAPARAPARGAAGATAKPAAAARRPATATAKAAAGKGAKPRARKLASTGSVGSEAAPAATGPDPDGFFVARVRGEEEMRHAPHPMTEAPVEGAARWEEHPPSEGSHPVLPAYEEHLGELPSGYGDDAFIMLPRDPRTLFFYWDLSAATVRAAFEGLDGPRAQLWILAERDGGWERVRVLDFALESRTFYVTDLEPGRVYRGEMRAVDRHGNTRQVGPSTNELGLPPIGASSIVDDRFARIPWDLPLPRLLGRGRPGGAFSEDLRALLARLSDWGRFPDRPWGGSVAGGGARPSSPSFAPSFFPDDAPGRNAK